MHSLSLLHIHSYIPANFDLHHHLHITSIKTYNSENRISQNLSINGINKTSTVFDAKILQRKPNFWCCHTTKRFFIFPNNHRQRISTQCPQVYIFLFFCSVLFLKTTFLFLGLSFSFLFIIFSFITLNHVFFKSIHWVV